MLLYDTNIVIYITADSSRAQRVRNFVNPGNEPECVSIVSVGEVQAFAMQRKWQAARIQRLTQVLKDLVVLGIDEGIVSRYVDADSYSRNRHPSRTKPGSPVQMGKNDLWIAATAGFFSLPLLTTDGDFRHLDSSHLTLRHIAKKTLVALI